MQSLETELVYIALSRDYLCDPCFMQTGGKAPIIHSYSYSLNNHKWYTHQLGSHYVP